MSDAAALLAKHAKKKLVRCLACREPHAAAVGELLDCAVESGEVVTMGQIHGALVEWTKYPNTEGALARHFQLHDRERWHLVNLVRRGPVG